MHWGLLRLTESYSQKHYSYFATAVAINSVGYITINIIIILHQKWGANKKGTQVKINSGAFSFCYNKIFCNFNCGLGFGDGIDLACGKALNTCAAQRIIYGVNDRIIIDQIKAQSAG